MKSVWITASIVGAVLACGAAYRANAFQEDELTETHQRSEVAQVSKLLASFHVARSALQSTGDEGFIMGSFYSDIERCVDIFSRQHQEVFVDNYIISFRYSGDSVGYMFHALDRVDTLVRSSENPWPPTPSFSCVRIASWGDRLLVNVEE